MGPMTDTSPHTLTYAAAAARFGVSTRTLARLVAAGTITRHRHPTDKRVVLLDPHEIATALEVTREPVEATTDDHAPTVSATITVAEGATLLNLAVTMDQHDVYHLLRGQLTDEFLEAVTIVLGGADRLAELDTAAGYSPVEES